MSHWVQGQIVGKRSWTDSLFSLRIDAPVEMFQAGQFTQLALDIDGERIGRPYSFVNAPDERPLEFHFITIPRGPLTDRLRHLDTGDMIWIAARPAGYFTLAGVRDAEHLWLMATGTALGVFLSLLKTGEIWRRFGRVILVHAARMRSELTYQEEILGFCAARPDRFTYVPFVSREDTGFAIRDRIPNAITDGRLEEAAGAPLRPDDSQVMLCGNPGMVRDTTRVLEARGFTRNLRKSPGNITSEHYW
jgi:ferredoxin/flavodoxin---NADP+ reductase